jgi:hypothetical protein
MTKGARMTCPHSTPSPPDCRARSIADRKEAFTASRAHVTTSNSRYSGAASSGRCAHGTSSCRKVPTPPPTAPPLACSSASRAASAASTSSRSAASSQVRPASSGSSTLSPAQPKRRAATHSTTPHDTARHTARHRTTPHDTQHDTARHSTTQHDTARHSTTQHDTARHRTTQHDTARHSTRESLQRHACAGAAWLSTGVAVLQHTCARHDLWKPRTKHCGEERRRVLHALQHGGHVRVCISRGVHVQGRQQRVRAGLRRSSLQGGRQGMGG